MVLKYRINFYLDQMPFDKRKDSITQLPDILEVSRKTFDRWRSIKLVENKSIPADKLRTLSIFFSLTMEDLFAYEDKNVQLITGSDNLAKELGLSK